jgi:hypothetical protein
MKWRSFNFEFVFNGESKPCTAAIKGVNAGHAQKRFHSQYPDGRILRTWSDAWLGGRRFGKIEYETVSVAKVTPLPPTPKVEELTFPFHDSCFSTRPPQDFKKSNH